jgi:NADH dehydrogenase [ubiquinone] 1 alpha subcomplex assembly factor 7
MAEEISPLEIEIRRLIALAGPMPVAEYMGLCLSHPRYGYYVTRDPIGAEGDFITAPEISQMFGELIGVWMASVWEQMRSPENVRVIELGPGRGTLMVDALRAAKVVRGFLPAIVLHFVEISPRLRQAQQQQLEQLKVPAMWHHSLADVPAGPSIIIANEFFDALPVHQAVKRAGQWHERVVNVTSGGSLAFALARNALPQFETTLPRALRQAQEGSIFEWRSDVAALELANRVLKNGAALVLDYGHSRSAMGDTLQAVHSHAYADPLQASGQVDLTAHVDFQALAQLAEGIGTRVQGPIPQRDFLFNLGIHARAATLKAKATEDQALAIDLAMSRLITAGPRGMGELFKALATSDPKLGPLAGFERPK